MQVIVVTLPGLFVPFLGGVLIDRYDRRYLGIMLDIARGLATPLLHAERMKTQIGRAVSRPNDEYDIIDVPLIGEEDRTRPNHIPR